MDNSFIGNHCRFCRKAFCCIDCRTNHEIEKHKIYKKCEICLNGKAIIKDFAPELMEHIKTTHLPLHCVNCNKTFNDIEQLQDKDCRNHSTPKPSSINLNTPNHSSENPLNMFKILLPAFKGKHSTPLQCFSPDRVQELIVENNKSSIKFTNDSKKKVTFVETPIIQSKTKLEETDDLFYTASETNVPPSQPETPIMQNSNLWNSMKSFFSGLANSSSIKRSHDDLDEGAPSYKRMKIIDIKCRRPIRHISPLETIRMERLKYIDKATQTDFL